MANSARNTITTVAGTEFRRLHLREELTDGTDKGANVISAWTTRDISTVVENAVPGATLSSNQITLPAGTYRMKATMLYYVPSYVRTRLQNITDAATIEHSINAYAAAGSGAVLTPITLETRFTIAATKTLELQYYTTVVGSAQGLGFDDTISGTPEYYVDIVIDQEVPATSIKAIETGKLLHCLLYTSDAADE